MVEETPLLRHTTLIRYELGSVRYSATGCFVRDDDGTDYLVTNKHVVKHEHGISPEFLSFFVRSKNMPTEKELKEISLETGGQNILLHPTYESADIAAIPLEFTLNDFGSVPVELDMFLPGDSGTLLAGGDAIVLGYPKAIREERTFYPIIRRAIVSTPFSHDFNEEPCFLIDAKMHKGMSGSPVFTTPSGQYLSTENELVVWRDDETDEIAIPLMGFHSGPIDEENELGLHKVWRANLLRDIF